LQKSARLVETIESGYRREETRDGWHRLGYLMGVVRKSRAAEIARPDAIDNFILREIQVLLSEKRTALAAMRTACSSRPAV
jgi:hypothetical protein